jgi:hypothetical protein
MVCGEIPFKNTGLAIEHVLTFHKQLVESYYPIFIQN